MTSFERRVINQTYALWQGFRRIFAREIILLRNLVRSSPFTSLGLALLVGIILGGVLRSDISQFVIISIVGGFQLAIAFGSASGIPVFASAVLVVPINAFVAYITLRILFAVEQYHSGAKKYLTTLKTRYSQSSQYLVARAGRLGVDGALVIATLIVGWWMTIMMSYLMEVDTATTMRAITVGLIMGAGVSIAVNEGLISALPNQLLVSAILFVAFAILARIIIHLANSDSALNHGV